MKTTILYKGPHIDDDWPILYEGDVITSLLECPFPVWTDRFEVLEFGVIPEDMGEGENRTFVIVRYTKPCGHRVEERVQFIEGVQTFTHYGTTFDGLGYSIKSWESRIEFFRKNLPCDVCGTVRHLAWLFGGGLLEGVSSHRKLEAHCLSTLDERFLNWEEMIDRTTVKAVLTGWKVEGPWPSWAEGRVSLAPG